MESLDRKRDGRRVVRSLIQPGDAGAYRAREGGEVRAEVAAVARPGDGAKTSLVKAGDHGLAIIVRERFHFTRHGIADGNRSTGRRADACDEYIDALGSKGGGAGGGVPAKALAIGDEQDEATPACLLVEEFAGEVEAGGGARTAFEEQCASLDGLDDGGGGLQVARQWEAQAGVSGEHNQGDAIAAEAGEGVGESGAGGGEA